MNEQAERIAQAIREELSRRARKEFGSYPAIAEALGESKKMVYRYMTPTGKDALMPPLPFVVQTVALLQSRGGDTFEDFIAAATQDVNRSELD